MGQRFFSMLSQWEQFRSVYTDFNGGGLPRVAGRDFWKDGKKILESFCLWHLRERSGRESFVAQSEFAKMNSPLDWYYKCKLYITDYLPRQRRSKISHLILPHHVSFVARSESFIWILYLDIDIIEYLKVLLDVFQFIINKHIALVKCQFSRQSLTGKVKANH